MNIMIYMIFYVSMDFVLILEKEIATTHQSLLNFVSSRKYTWQKFT